MKKKYKFSVIIPIYNVENYLEETIDSVINQTIGFNDNIQLILINDGSPDSSEEICERYKKEYPNNIIYLKQENSGVSVARNKGLELATGEIINFLDSDDKWEKDVFKKVQCFFKKEKDVNLVACRMRFFEARNNYHPLDYKFDKNKVVNIHEEYSNIQLSSSSVFFKSEIIKKHKYDFNLKYSEDGKLMSEILLENEKIGYLRDAVYLYRKRLSDNSAINTKNTKKEWYIDTPIHCYKYLFDLSKKKYGKVIPYIQYAVMYDYQYRAKEEIPECISNNIKKEYLEITKNLFREIDDNIILEQKKLPVEYKIELLNLKYGRDITKELIRKENTLALKENIILHFKRSNYFTIEIINFKDNGIELRGFSNLPLNNKDCKIYCIVNDEEEYELELKETRINVRKIFNEEFMCNKGYKIDIKSKDIKNIHFKVKYKNQEEFIINPKLSLNSKLDNKLRLYYIKNDRIYFYKSKRIESKKNNLINRFLFKTKYYLQLLKRKRIKNLAIRIMVDIFKLFKKSEIWLISDRPLVANDNGYAFYKYCCDNKESNIKTYFVISKSSKDFQKVKSTGNYLIYNSLKYKLYFLIADKIVSSQADTWVYNAFGKSNRYYRDLYDFELVFLQHGIIKEDLSTWLNCYQKNFRIFVTSANDEYTSIINGEYGYDEEIVKLTGLPRYDLLKDKKEKILLIMPTWRKKLAGAFDKAKGNWNYNPDFKKSDYYNFYNALINDKRLLECMRNNQYKGIFVIHPSHSVQTKDFQDNDIIKVENELANYSELFSRGNLLVTDYSSIMFDFGYLKKPSVYTQFDFENFFSSHIYTKGYFDYEKDGFGEVTYDYETTIAEIIKSIEQGCKLDSKYKKRIEKFYKYTDKKNCERVYKEIKKLK